MSRLKIVGHVGFGDNIHQRAPIRKMLARGDEIWLHTQTPCIYHDLGPRLHLLRADSHLRTQRKNADRESQRFEATNIPLDVPTIMVRYDGQKVRAAGSVVAAMCDAFKVSREDADFRMPVPAKWTARTPIPRRPYIVYRPPVARTEWLGAAPRNPDPEAYREIFAAIRAGFDVVSIADLEDGNEWIVGAPIEAATSYHRGELDFEQVAAMVAGAALVYTTPGFVTVLAQAVEVPCITVFGGYERAASFTGGAKWAPWLPIEPINPCDCWRHDHPCDKRIDVDRAIADALGFVVTASRAAA